MEFKESLRIGKGKMTLTVFVVTAQDGDYFFSFCPSLNISGYGKSKEDSHLSFQHNIEVFIKDIKTLSKKGLESYLFSLGWSKDTLKNKIFSHLYVDENGELIGDLEQVNKSVETLEFCD